jgi:orotate phosphoribosyltransferase
MSDAPDPANPLAASPLTVQQAHAIERAVGARATAYILLEIGAALCYTDQPFTFTSGRRSPVYVDCRQLISYPRARAKLMDLAVETIQRDIGFESIDVIAGGETAGIAFAAWIAERMSLPMVYVRKEPKGFGRMAQIEGHMPEGSRVLLVEDLATDGGSKINFIRAIRNAGAEVNDCLVLFHYGIYPVSVSSLAQEGVQLHGLATWWDVIAEAEARKYFPPDKALEVRAFLNDPENWVPKES